MIWLITRTGDIKMNTQTLLKAYMDAAPSEKDAAWDAYMKALSPAAKSDVKNMVRSLHHFIHNA